MTNLFGLGHIAQLHEIQSARLKRNQPGIGPEVEELIARLRDGGVLGNQPDERTRQAKVLWDLGFGRELGFGKFEDYLATIPSEIPKNDRPDLFDRLVLVERGLGVVRTVKLVGLDCPGHYGEILKDYYDYSGVEFIWCQDGRRNNNKSVNFCRKTFVDAVEIGMTAVEGLCLYAHDRSVTHQPNDHVVECPGTYQKPDRRGNVALIRPDGRFDISTDGARSTHPQFGCASRRV